ncbi:MAG: hypothetical protein WBG92_21920 [Thiohalocapsa sp.]
MNSSQATTLYDLASGLASITKTMLRIDSDGVDSDYVYGLRAAAAHLADELEKLTWTHVEAAGNATVHVPLHPAIEAKLLASAEAAGCPAPAQAANLLELALRADAAVREGGE